MGAFQKNVILWKGGIIPYQPNTNHPFWKLIKKAINEINNRTIIKFVVSENKDGLIFTSEPVGNYATVGIVNIDKNIRALHELVHIIGMVHEHQREDRDSYVTIHETFLIDNVFTQTQIKEKLQTEDTTLYDINSCQHYWGTAGIKNGLKKNAKTITYNNDISKKLETAEILSNGDINCINKKYENKSKTIKEFLLYYPSLYIDQIYLIKRNNCWKKLFPPKKTRANQLNQLKLAINGIETNTMIKENLINTIVEIINEIKKEKNCLGQSMLQMVCEDIYSFCVK